MRDMKTYGLDDLMSEDVVEDGGSRNVRRTLVSIPEARR